MVLTVILFLFLCSSIDFEQTNLPVLSCVSMESEDSMKTRHDFTKEDSDRYT